MSSDHNTKENQSKGFIQLRNEAANPYVKLAYEVLSRFHTHDYNMAIESMSEDMRKAIIACDLPIAKIKVHGCIVHYKQPTQTDVRITHIPIFQYISAVETHKSTLDLLNIVQENEKKLRS